MITYNELVDLVEKINPDQILEEIKGVLQTALLQIKEYVDNKVASIPKLYQHNITFRDNANNIGYTLSYTSRKDTSFTDNQRVNFSYELRDAICSDILSVNPIPTGSTGVPISVSASPYQSGSSFNFPQVCIVFAENIICQVLDYNGTNLSVRTNTLNSLYTIEDKCVEL